MRVKYPPIEPNQTGYLNVGEGHKIYWEDCGNPKGVPVCFLHGGPGSGISPDHRSFFDSRIYRIILFDQRGCGKSTPHAELRANTLWDLISDMEKLRIHLQVAKWVLFGGSWGSTLALVYAIEYPLQVLALILRGIFLGRKSEINWVYQSGARYFRPEEFAKYLEPIPFNEREDLLSAYYRRLTSKDPSIRKRAASAWAAWEGVNLRLQFDPQLHSQFVEDDHADALARLECHYFVNNCYLSEENQILNRMDRIKHIEGMIVQGRYDLVCPPISAWELHKKWPNSELKMIEDAGHSSSEMGILNALMEATDYFGNKLS